MTERDWRLDQTRPADSDSPLATLEATIAASCTGRRPGTIFRWKEEAGRWMRRRIHHLLGPDLMSSHEAVVHELGRLLGDCHDPARIEAALMDSVRTITGVEDVSWVRDTGSAAPAPKHGFKLPLRVGQRDCGQLFITPTEPEQELRLSAGALDRLRTVCTMAACAWEQASGIAAPTASWPHDLPSSGADARNARAEMPDGWNLTTRAAGADGDLSTVGPGLQDATFLNAVLPFALGQARRHAESLSLLCVAVDRLNGIHDLLGKDRARTAVSNVGLHITRMIRTSDLVARLDDDRIIVVLPRAQVHDAWRIAMKVCRTIEQNRTLLPELPGLTVSIGVAEYPSCADSVYGLLDAADHALTVAKSQGRNRAIAAECMTSRDSAERVSCAS